MSDDDPVTIYKTRIKKKNKNLLEDLFRILIILFGMGLFFFIFYAVDIFVKAD